MAGNITVKGGKKLTRFIREVTDPEFELAILSKVLRQYIVPMLKRFAPRRTGRLRRSGSGGAATGRDVGSARRFLRAPCKISYKGQPVTMPELTGRFDSRKQGACAGTLPAGDPQRRKGLSHEHLAVG